MSTSVIHQPHKLGIVEAQRRILALGGKASDLEITHQEWDTPTHTLTVDLAEHGVPVHLQLVVGEWEVVATENDNLPKFIDWLVVRPKVQAMLAEALR